MWRTLIPLSLLQSFTLATGQMMLKLALRKMGHYSGIGQFFANELTNWWWYGCGTLLTGAMLLWMYILKHFPFSMLGAWIFLGEAVPPIRWVGVVLILIGAYFIAR